MKRPPKYMVDLYKTIADQHGVARSPQMLQVDIVRSIPNTGERQCVVVITFHTSKRIFKILYFLLFQKHLAIKDCLADFLRCDSFNIISIFLVLHSLPLHTLSILFNVTNFVLSLECCRVYFSGGGTFFKVRGTSARQKTRKNFSLSGLL